MLHELANTSLGLSLVLCLYVAIASICGFRKDQSRLLYSAENGVRAIFILVTFAVAVLMLAFMTHDFRLAYVAGYSSRDMSPLYLLASFYAGNEGSLLFWAWLLAFSVLVAVSQGRRRYPELIPYATAVLMAAQFFFLMLVLFVANPFQTGNSLPADGLGLNPLLENPGMLIHPPALLAGYVTAVVPFAYVITALANRVGDDRWLRPVRTWMLVSWLFLGVGNILGAQWAYVELGWGGYWAWDPVENAGLMPWLTATAFLHSAIAQRTRGMFRIWGIMLVIITFALTVFGTFLARSGILSSLHTYGESALTPFFLVFIGITLIGSLLLVVIRRKQYLDLSSLTSWFSREGGFMLISALLVASALAVLLGTIFPIFLEWIRGTTVNVTAAFYNQVNVPIFIAAVFLMAVCPFFIWGKGLPLQSVRVLVIPATLSVVAAVVLAVFIGGEWFMAPGLALCLFVLLAMAISWYREFRVRRTIRRENPVIAFGRMILANRPRYGGYLIHLGILLATIGVLGSTGYKLEQEASLKPGESLEIGVYKLTYDNLHLSASGSKDVVTAKMSVYENGVFVGFVFPEKYFHRNYEQPVTEVAIRSTIKEDLYVILAGWDRERVASFRIVVNPLVIWIWIGGGVLTIGALLALWPGPGRQAR